MPLATDRDLEFFATSELLDFPIDAGARIFKGALVGRNRQTLLARPLVAGDEFLGVAYRGADNTYPGNIPGGVDVRVFQDIDIVDAVAGVGGSDAGREVYAADDNSLSVNPGSGSREGRIVTVLGGGLARVRCQPCHTYMGVNEGQPHMFLANANHTLGYSHLNRVLLMANTAARTLTLPPVALARAGSWIRLMKTSAAAVAITLDGAGTETIDGAATYSGVDAQYDCVELLCTGTEWVILSRDIA
jgi:hypothetical protein